MILDPAFFRRRLQRRSEISILRSWISSSESASVISSISDPKNPQNFSFTRCSSTPTPYVEFFQALTRRGGRSSLRQGRQIHAQLVVQGINPSAYLAAKMVSMYCGSQDINSAEIVFKQVEYPSARLYNAIIRGQSLFGDSDHILPLFQKMHSSGVEPDHFTFPFVLKTCAKLQFHSMGSSLHSICLRLGLEIDAYVSTSLIDMYAKLSDVIQARRLFDLSPFKDLSAWNALIAGHMKNCEVGLAQELFDEMPERNIVSWTAMISGFSQNGLADRALALFEEMLGDCGDGVKPNWVTVMSVLPACVHTSALNYGEKLHRYATTMGYDTKPCVAIALVAMYARCGSLVNARHCFDQLRDVDKDVVAFNTMITGYSLHGKGADAIVIFEEMVNLGVHPDEISFIGLLSGCSHSGLVDQGLKHFDAMERFYSVKPKLQHYACVVDLLGRAGRLSEAKKLVDEMPVEAGPSIWGSLLASSRRHHNLEIGEFAAKKLFEMEPENTGNFVLLSNLYAEGEKWEEVGTIRETVKGKNLSKNPGCSWIELEGKLHSFLSGDTSHPQVVEIYKFLEDILRRIKRDGYVPDTALVLHDVAEEDKEFSLMAHSEKLAVAFGILNSGPGVVIRVTKNLRICGDCHAAFKCVSVSYNREIIVRDINRFHHFEKGVCSCGDFW